MSISAIVAAGIGGAVGGALGALLGAAAGRLFPERWRRPIAVVVSVALAVICSRLAVTYHERNQFAPSTIEAQMLADPEGGNMVRAWKEADPASFATFIARISQGAQAGADRSAVINAARQTLMSEVKVRIAHLNDEQVIELIRVSTDQFRELERTHPESCKPLFLGADFGDITPYLSAGVRQRELSLIEAAFRADLNATPSSLSGSALGQAVDTLLRSTQNVVGDDVSLLANGADISGRERRYCEVVATLFDQLAAMPAADGAALMRGLRAAS